MLDEGITNNTWVCKENPEDGDADPECKYELFNTIVDMVVHSDCNFTKDPISNISYVTDRLTFDWTHTNDL